MEDVDAEVDVDQGRGEASPGRVEVSWIVVHPDRNAVLLLEGNPPFRPTSCPVEPGWVMLPRSPALWPRSALTPCCSGVTSSSRIPTLECST